MDVTREEKLMREGESLTPFFERILQELCYFTFGDILEIYTQESRSEKSQMLAYAMLKDRKEMNKEWVNKVEIMHLPAEFFIIGRPSFPRRVRRLAKYWNSEALLISLAAHELRHRFQRINPGLELFKTEDFDLEDGWKSDDAFEEDANVVQRLYLLLWEEGLGKIKTLNTIADIIRWTREVLN